MKVTMYILSKTHEINPLQTNTHTLPGPGLEEWKSVTITATASPLAIFRHKYNLAYQDITTREKKLMYILIHKTYNEF